VFRLCRLNLQIFSILGLYYLIFGLYRIPFTLGFGDTGFAVFYMIQVTNHSQITFEFLQFQISVVHYGI